MSDKRYTYTGKVPTGATLKLDKKSQREVMLWPKKEVSLPPDNGWVQRLVAKKLLVEVAAESKPDAKPDPQGGAGDGSGPSLGGSGTDPNLPSPDLTAAEGSTALASLGRSAPETNAPKTESRLKTKAKEAK